ncbi:uncharacterized protein LOC133556490 isoform X5 [Nerophis ophidion]|uniref:uncharacterized protein LOC133556490 isoform X5 n=1 Tax=Nerophis ophidion TaxID=159077 RepID=UPI002ADFB268|nr:uncharacterized protein LOC133556490 isoform X5 [Nerophis ophidion]
METFSLKTNQPLDPATLASPDLLSDMSDMKIPVLLSEQGDRFINVDTNSAKWTEGNETLAKYGFRERHQKAGEIQSEGLNNAKDQESGARKAEQALVKVRIVPVEQKSTSNRTATENRDVTSIDSCLSTDQMGVSQELVQNTQLIMKSNGKKRPPDIKKPIRRKLRDRDRSGYSSSEGELETMSSEESLDGDAVLNERDIFPTPVIDPPASPRVVETPIGSIKDRVKALQNKVEEEEGQKHAVVQISRSSVTTTKMEGDMPQLPSLPKSPKSQTERLEETMSVKELMKAFQTGQDPSKNKSGLFEHKALASCDFTLTSKSADSEEKQGNDQSPALTPQSHSFKDPYENEFQGSDTTDSENQPIGILKGTSKESLLNLDANVAKTVTFCDDAGIYPRKMSTESSERESMSVKELTRAFQTGQDPSKSKLGLCEHKSTASSSISIEGSQLISDSGCIGNNVERTDTFQHKDGMISPRSELLPRRGLGMIQVGQQSTGTGMALSEDLQISPDRRPSEDFSADIKAELEESPEYLLFKKTSTALDVSNQLETSDEETLVDRVPFYSPSIGTVSIENQNIFDGTQSLENMAESTDKNVDIWTPQIGTRENYEGLEVAQQMNNDTDEVIIEEPVLEGVHIGRKNDNQRPTIVKDMSGLESFMATDLDQCLATSFKADQPPQEDIIDTKFEQIILTKDKEKDFHPIASDTVAFSSEHKYVEETPVSGEIIRTPLSSLGEDYEGLAVVHHTKANNEKVIDDEPLLDEVSINRKTNSEASIATKDTSGLESFTATDLNQCPAARFGADQPQQEDITEENVEQVVLNKKENYIHEITSDEVVFGTEQTYFEESVTSGDQNRRPHSSYGEHDELLAVGSQNNTDNEKSNVDEALLEEVYISRNNDGKAPTQAKDMSGLESFMAADLDECPAAKFEADQPEQEDIIEEHFEQSILTEDKKKDIHQITSDEDVFGTEHKYFEETVISGDRNRTPYSSLGEDDEILVWGSQMNTDDGEITVDRPLPEEVHMSKTTDNQLPTGVKGMLESFMATDLGQCLPTKFVADQPQQENIIEENDENIILTKDEEKYIHQITSDEVVFGTEHKYYEGTIISGDRNRTPCSSLREDDEGFAVGPQMNTGDEGITVNEPLLEEVHISRKSDGKAPTQAKDMSGMESFMAADLDQCPATRFVADQPQQEDIIEEHFEQIILTKDKNKDIHQITSDEVVFGTEHKYFEDTVICGEGSRTPFASLGEDDEVLAVGSQMNTDDEQISVDEPIFKEVHISRKSDSKASIATKDMSGLESIMAADLDQCPATTFVADQPQQEDIIEEHFEQIILTKDKNKDIHQITSDEVVFGTEHKYFEDTVICGEGSRTPFSSLGEDDEVLAVGSQMNTDDEQISVDEPIFEEVHISRKSDSKASIATKDMSGLESIMAADLDQCPATRFVADQPQQEDIIEEHFQQIILTKDKKKDIHQITSDEDVFDTKHKYFEETVISGEANRTPYSSLGEDDEVLAVGSQMNTDDEEITVDEPLLEEVHISRNNYYKASTQAKDMSGLESFMAAGLDQCLATRFVADQSQQEHIFEEYFEQTILTKDKDKGIPQITSDEVMFGTEHKYFEEMVTREDQNRTPHSSSGEDDELLAVGPQMNTYDEDITVDEPLLEEVHMSRNSDSKASIAARDMSGLELYMATGLDQCLATRFVAYQPQQEDIIEEDFEQTILNKDKDTSIPQITSDEVVFGREHKYSEETVTREDQHRTLHSSLGEDDELLTVGSQMNTDDEKITVDEPLLEEVHISRNKDSKASIAAKDVSGLESYMATDLDECLATRVVAYRPQQEDFIEEKIEQTILTKDKDEGIHQITSDEDVFGMEHIYFEETVTSGDQHRTPDSSLGEDDELLAVGNQINTDDEEITVDRPLLEEPHISRKNDRKASIAAKDMSGLESYMATDLDECLATRVVVDRPQQEDIVEENFEQIILTKNKEKDIHQMDPDECVVRTEHTYFEDTVKGGDRNRTIYSSFREDDEELAVGPQMNTDDEENSMDEPLLEEVHISRKKYTGSKTSIVAKYMSGLLSLMTTDLDQCLATRFVADQPLQEDIIEENFEQTVLTKDKEKHIHQIAPGEVVLSTEHKYFDKSVKSRDSNRTSYSSLGEDEELAVGPQINTDNEDNTVDEPLFVEVHISKKKDSKATIAIKDMSGLESLMATDLDQCLATRIVAQKGTEEARTTFEDTHYLTTEEPLTEEWVGLKSSYQHSKNVKNLSGMISLLKSELDQDLMDRPVAHETPQEDLIQEQFQKVQKPSIEETNVEDKQEEQTQMQIDMADGKEKAMSGIMSVFGSDLEKCSKDYHVATQEDTISGGAITTQLSGESEMPINQIWIERKPQQEEFMIKQNGSGMLSLLNHDLDQCLKEEPVVIQGYPEEDVIHERCRQVIIPKYSNRDTSTFSLVSPNGNSHFSCNSESTVKITKLNETIGECHNDYGDTNVDAITPNIPQRPTDFENLDTVVMDDTVKELYREDSLEASPVAEDTSSKRSPDSIEPSPTRESPCPDSLEGSPTQSEKIGERIMHKAVVYEDYASQLKACLDYDTNICMNDITPDESETITQMEGDKYSTLHEDDEDYSINQQFTPEEEMFKMAARIKTFDEMEEEARTNRDASSFEPSQTGISEELFPEKDKSLKNRESESEIQDNEDNMTHFYSGVTEHLYPDNNLKVNPIFDNGSDSLTEPMAVVSAEETKNDTSSCVYSVTLNENSDLVEDQKTLDKSPIQSPIDDITPDQFQFKKGKLFEMTRGGAIDLTRSPDEEAEGYAFFQIEGCPTEVVSEEIREEQNTFSTFNKGYSAAKEILQKTGDDEAPTPKPRTLFPPSSDKSKNEKHLSETDLGSSTEVQLGSPSGLDKLNLIQSDDEGFKGYDANYLDTTIADLQSNANVVYQSAYSKQKYDSSYSSPDEDEEDQCSVIEMSSSGAQCSKKKESEPDLVTKKTDTSMKRRTRSETDGSPSNVSQKNSRSCSESTQLTYESNLSTAKPILSTKQKHKRIPIGEAEESSVSLDTDDISSSSCKSTDSVIFTYDTPASSSSDSDPVTAVRRSSSVVDVFESRPTWDDKVETQMQRITDDQTSECTAVDWQDDADRKEETLAIIADLLGFSWTELARELEFSEDDIQSVRSENPNSLQEQSHALLQRWVEREGKHATEDCLIKRLTKINRMDIVHLIETQMNKSIQEQTSRTYAEIEKTLDHSEVQEDVDSPRIVRRIESDRKPPPAVSEEDLSVASLLDIPSWAEPAGHTHSESMHGDLLEELEITHELNPSLWTSDDVNSHERTRYVNLDEQVSTASSKANLSEPTEQKDHYLEDFVKNKMTSMLSNTNTMFSENIELPIAGTCYPSKTPFETTLTDALRHDKENVVFPEQSEEFGSIINEPAQDSGEEEIITSSNSTPTGPDSVSPQLDQLLSDLEEMKDKFDLKPFCLPLLEPNDESSNVDLIHDFKELQPEDECPTGGSTSPSVSIIQLEEDTNKTNVTVTWSPPFQTYDQPAEDPVASDLTIIQSNLRTDRDSVPLSGALSYPDFPQTGCEIFEPSLESNFSEDAVPPIKYNESEEKVLSSASFPIVSEETSSDEYEEHFRSDNVQSQGHESLLLPGEREDTARNCLKDKSTTLYKEPSDFQKGYYSSDLPFNLMVDRAPQTTERQFRSAESIVCPTSAKSEKSSDGISPRSSVQYLETFTSERQLSFEELMPAKYSSDVINSKAGFQNPADCEVPNTQACLVEPNTEMPSLTSDEECAIFPVYAERDSATSTFSHMPPEYGDNVRSGAYGPASEYSDPEPFFDCRQATSDFSETEPDETEFRSIPSKGQPGDSHPGRREHVYRHALLSSGSEDWEDAFVVQETFRTVPNKTEDIFHSEAEELTVCEVPGSEIGAFDDTNTLTREINAELSSMSESSDDELLSTRIVRRRVVIQADEMPDLPTQSVTEEKYKDENGHIVVRKVSRKIIRKCVSSDGVEREEVSIEGTPHGSISVAEGDGYSKVVKRTVLKSGGDHTEVTFSECEGFSTSQETSEIRKVSLAEQTTVVEGKRTVTHKGDLSLASDLPSAQDDFKQALDYIGGLTRADLPHVVESETVKEDGTVVRRAHVREGHTLRQTVVQGAGQRKQVLLEQVDGPAEGSKPHELQRHLHQLFHHFYQEQEEDRDGDEEQ